MLEHGGRLIAAARCYEIALPHWLDLSTGINPLGWPVPAIPPMLWTRLPEDDDALQAQACRYYSVSGALPVAGTQAAIQALPTLRQRGRVGMTSPSYAEHALAWQRTGHTVRDWTPDQGVDELDALVLINPNNPTGTRYPVGQLLEWQSRLAAHGGWLVVDEAFLDATPEDSLAPYCDRSGLVVLRGLGKFFGLPGARVGFVLAAPDFLRRLRPALGPWTIANPSRWLAQQALADVPWQAQERLRLRAASDRLARLLRAHGLTPAGGTALFQWVPTPTATALHERLARHGILTRLFRSPSSLRFGLPGREADWERLAAALNLGDV